MIHISGFLLFFQAKNFWVKLLSRILNPLIISELYIETGFNRLMKLVWRDLKHSILLFLI